MASSMHLSRIRKWLASSPPVEGAIYYLRELLIGALRQGPIPQHVAFVMDGNRRFARNQGIERVEGHNLGFEALAKILEVCYSSGIKVVTIYAFSIENFKRSKYEVDALMEMAKLKLLQLSEHGELLERYGASVRVLGRRDQIRPDVLEAVDRTVELTSGNGDAILNICFPYTSRDEITSAVRNTVMEYSTPLDRTQLPAVNSPRRPFSEKRIVENIREHTPSADPRESLSNGSNSPVTTSSANETASDSNSSLSSATTLHLAASGETNGSSGTGKQRHHHHHERQHRHHHQHATASPELYTSYPPNSDQLLFHSPETITTQTLSDHMLTAGCPPLDILIRTSGVERLSDFMLWQCHQDTQIVFLDTLWPAFSLWEFLPVIWDWQRRIRKTGPRRELEFDFPSAYNSDSERMNADSPWLTEDDDIKFKSL
ncbi:di-trans,poly-cis-decaprenylcistransferase [Trichophyton rubrum D6]|uniref:Prenyltransferase n=4 Tax=Trichophyton TaxID=5550 RepID=A0A178F825_TRIRU|nr:di-trans,poly-cis-decaprenylcistransferase [Trichophyton rubrum CBS 118892]EZF26200.1 di-trans,poly-cis-decaprenylcistransferase [Trichophyton rubrum MR850]EZF45185.1 di-trans,poly-cis-decaprenylcistransferase [Trichophyton rubrum CBS 100081]EZF55834.1 di-trans,poly-cis-decaprenylcistransferase [Trichophyton rubrum CBS 288.86]EZF66451.1 di-trans,poly-cis-decaprenylcistransferase [Trichophyton rubrum CBS 289.86]EZF77094.1 di-trans,poly-cis-decaprenylcistransferase [Trichophyton soudanense CB